jgi:lipopolysaccharide transport system ATP-binding protein
MTSASIKLKNVNVAFPVYNASSLSLKNRALNTITGGAIDRHQDGISLVKSLENINLNISWDIRTHKR